MSNPDQLVCRCCGNNIRSEHGVGCAYRYKDLCHMPRSVHSDECNYDDLYRLPGEFELDLGATYYCHIRNAYRSAKNLISDIEKLCKDNDVKIPTEQ